MLKNHPAKCYLILLDLARYCLILPTVNLAGTRKTILLNPAKNLSCKILSLARSYQYYLPEWILGTYIDLR